jgi:hypothetical protein
LQIELLANTPPHCTTNNPFEANLVQVGNDLENEWKPPLFLQQLHNKKQH